MWVRDYKGKQLTEEYEKSVHGCEIDYYNDKQVGKHNIWMLVVTRKF